MLGPDLGETRNLRFDGTSIDPGERASSGRIERYGDLAESPERPAVLHDKTWDRRPEGTGIGPGDHAGRECVESYGDLTESQESPAYGDLTESQENLAFLHDNGEWAGVS